MFRAGAIAVTAILLIAAVPIPSPSPRPTIATESQGPEQGIRAQDQAKSTDQSPAKFATTKLPKIKSEAAQYPLTDKSQEQPQRGMDLPAWVEAISALFTMLFTGLLFVATYRLWNSTKGLYDETKRLAGLAEAQEKDTKASIAAAQKSADAAEKSANLAIAAQRPWLDFEVAVISEMILDDKMLRFGLNIVLTNVGNSPAIDARVFNCPMPEPFNKSMLGESVAQANTLASNLGKMNFGSVIFPGKSEPMNLMVVVQSDAYNAAVATGGGKTIALALRVDYRFIGGEGVRSAAFVVWGTNFKEGGNGPLDFSNGPIPPGVIRLQKVPILDVAT